jgi:hypothetical protein
VRGASAAHDDGENVDGGARLVLSKSIGARLGGCNCRYSFKWCGSGCGLWSTSFPLFESFQSKNIGIRRLSVQRIKDEVGFLSEGT